MQTVHTFRSSGKAGLYGYTAKRDGTLLPRKPGWGDWVYCGEMAVFERQRRTAVNITEMLRRIKRAGYCVFDSAQHARSGPTLNTHLRTCLVDK